MLRRIKHFLQRKGFNFDVMVIEQVVVVYNAVNEFVGSDKKNKIQLLHSNNYRFWHVWRINRNWFSLALSSQTAQSAQLKMQAFAFGVHKA